MHFLENGTLRKHKREQERRRHKLKHKALTMKTYDHAPRFQCQRRLFSWGIIQGVNHESLYLCRKILIKGTEEGIYWRYGGQLTQFKL